MNKPRIALIVDQPQRDLAGLVLTASELCQLDATCYLVPANLRKREIWALMPDFVLLFNLRRGFEGLLRQLAEAGIRFGVLDTEGGVWPNFSDYTDILITDQQLRQKVSCVCAWGPKFAEHLALDGQFARDQVSVTGCPRFDFYDPTWKSVLDESSTNGAKSANPARQRILINTNYTEANPRFTSLEGMVRHLCEILGCQEPWARKVIDTQLRAIDATIELARDLARDYAHLSIVLRPHPFEGTEVYLSRLGDISNIEVNVSGSVQSQIFRALATIQRTSTTAIETNLAGVPALSPQWIPPAFDMPMVEAVSLPCQSYDDMRRRIDAIIQSQYTQPAQIHKATSDVINDWFFRIDGQSHKRVSETVSMHLDGKRVVDEKLCLKYLYGLDETKKRKTENLARLVRYRLGLTPDWSFRQFGRATESDWTQTDQYYGLAEVSDLVRKVEHARPGGENTNRPVGVHRAEARCNQVVHSVMVSCDA